MKDTRSRERTQPVEPTAATQGERKPYRSPRIEKKRAVSRATLFTGSGPDAGGVITN